MSTSNPVAWRFDTAVGTIPVTALVDSQPAPKRGDTADYGVLLVADGRGDHVTRYEQLIAYKDFGGEYTPHEVGGGLVAYTETHAENAPGGSLLVAVRPPSDDLTGRGVWGLVDGVGDNTVVPQERCRLTLSIAYLAPLAEYDSRTELAANLEAPRLF